MTGNKKNGRPCEGLDASGNTASKMMDRKFGKSNLKKLQQRINDSHSDEDIGPGSQSIEAMDVHLSNQPEAGSSNIEKGRRGGSRQGSSTK